MFKRVTLISLSALLASQASVAIPLDPTENNVAQYFSVDMQDKYYLYADSIDTNLVWYIPKTGFVSSKGRGDRIAPNFNASESIPSFGIWSVLLPGEPQLRLGGTLNTTGDIESLRILQEEAKGVLGGSRVAPAVAMKAKSTLLAEGAGFNALNRVKVDCGMEIIEDFFDRDGNPVEIFSCSTTATDGTKVRTSTLERAIFKSPPGRTSVSARIPFQIVTLPSYDTSSIIMDIIYNGTGSLDNYFQLVIDWELDTGRETRVAKIEVDWNQTFEQARTFSAVHLNSCLEVEVQTFFKKLVQEGKGVVVEYLWPDGSYRLEAPSDAEFIKVVEGVTKDMQDELFDQIRAYSTPVLGEVNTDVDSVFTLRANYEKQILEKHETRYINWNPGMSMETAQTNIGIDCVEGGFGDRVIWSNRPECQAVIGTITDTNE